MEQGSYKALFVKLSGVVFGLVVMLAGAAMLTRNFSLNSPDQAVYEKFTGSNSVAEGNLNEVHVMLRDMQSEYLRKMIDSKSQAIMLLQEAIATLTGQIAIPGTLRKNILADIERQLTLEQKERGELENYRALLSSRIKPATTRIRRKPIEVLTWI